MKLINVLILIVAALLIALAVINWALLVAPIYISLGVAHASVPLGLLFLGVGAVLTVVFVGYLLKIQLSALSAARRHAAELRRQRELADAAETSRFAELRQYLERELAALGQAQRASEQRLQEQIVTASNSLSACIGEIDERLERQQPVPPEQQP